MLGGQNIIRKLFSSNAASLQCASLALKNTFSPIQVTTRRNSKFSPFSNLFNRSGSNSGGGHGSGAGGGGATSNAEDSAAPPSIDNKENLELLGDGIDFEPSVICHWPSSHQSALVECHILRMVHANPTVEAAVQNQQGVMPSCPMQPIS